MASPTKISRDSLMTLEAYAKGRKDFRARVMAHKKDRTLHLGEHVTLIFEDERHVLAEMEGAVLLVRHHPGAEVLAALRVRLERHERAARDLSRGGRKPFARG